MAKTRVCEDLFMRPGCGRQFSAGWFSRARQCPTCTSAFLVPLPEVEQVGPVRVTDVGLLGRRSNLVSGWESLRHPRVRGLELRVDIGQIVADRFDLPPTADAGLASDLGWHVGLLANARSGSVLDGDAVGGDFMFERPAING